MTLTTKSFKEACQTILFAIDSKESTLFTETLELSAKGNVLYLNVTNQEYYVSVKFNLDREENFTASVNAKTFLTLMGKITTEDLSLSIGNKELKISANGEYTLPLYDLTLPNIELGEITNDMELNSSTLLSILQHNRKELLRGTIAQPVQKYYYMDELGAITFTTGACVNNFTLPKPVKLLLSDKVVKLFKLFGSDNKVYFKLGQFPIADGIIQSRIEFANDRIILKAKLQESGLVSTVPVKTIRDMTTRDYSYTIKLNRVNLIQALDRILLFNDGSKTWGNINIKDNSFIILNSDSTSNETIVIDDNSTPMSSYSMILDLAKLKLILEGNEDDYITLCFGDHRSVVVKKQNICDIIPELRIS